MKGPLWQWTLSPRNHLFRRLKNGSKALDFNLREYGTRNISSLNIVQEYRNLNKASDAEDRSSPFVHFRSLKGLYANFNHNLKFKNKFYKNLDEGRLEKSYSSLGEVITAIEGSIGELDGRDKENLIQMLIKINGIISKSELNQRIDSLMCRLVTPSSREDLLKIFKLLVKYKYKLKDENLTGKIDLGNATDDYVFDLFWCVATLGLGLKNVNKVLENAVPRVEGTSIINNLKFMNSLYTVYSDLKIGNVQNNLILSKAQTEESEVRVSKEMVLEKIKLIKEGETGEGELMDRQKELITEVIEYVRGSLMKRIEEFESTRTLCNFIFYVTSTINNFKLENYSPLLERLVKLIDEKNDMRIEGLIQMFWSLQKNNIYPKRLLKLLTSKLEIFMDEYLRGERGPKWLSIGHVSLCLYSLTYFNLLTEELSAKSLKYLTKHNEEYKREQDPSKDVLKETNILWAICLTNINKMDKIIDEVVSNLNKIDWTQFQTKSEFEDLHKLMQIVTIINLQEGTRELKIPESVIKMAENACQTNVDYKNNSVTQDKVRRVLESMEANFKSENKINSHIMVDFVVYPGKGAEDSSIQSRDDPANSSTDQNSTEDATSLNLVIEIDGPYHYNILMDEGGQEEELTEDFIKHGTVTLILNGKTAYRNKVLKRLGYEVVSIPWFLGYQTSFHEIVQNILTDHKIV